jgi:hypothetical protein
VDTMTLSLCTSGEGVGCKKSVSESIKIQIRF